MRIIGISGFARSGKDTLGKFLKNLFEQDNKKVVLESFAKPLRSEMFETVDRIFNLDVYTNDENEKEIIRPLMVGWAEVHRKRTNGNYFADKLQERIDLIRDDIDYCIITDFRFGQYYSPENNYDELGFIKKNNGFIIHLKQYSVYEGQKIFLSAPNEMEEKNDPIIQNNADCFLTWPKTKNQRLLEQYGESVYKQIIK